MLFSVGELPFHVERHFPFVTDTGGIRQIPLPVAALLPMGKATPLSMATPLPLH